MMRLIFPNTYGYNNIKKSGDRTNVLQECLRLLNLLGFNITVLKKCLHKLLKTFSLHGASFLNHARNSHCTVITDLDTSKRSTQKAFSCCDAILETGLAASKAERTAGSAWETWTFAAAEGVRFARVRWEINFLLTFETAPFFCKHTVYAVQQDTQSFFMIFFNHIC